MLWDYSLDSSAVIVKIAHDDSKQIQISRGAEQVGVRTVTHDYEDVSILQQKHWIEIPMPYVRIVTETWTRRVKIKENNPSRLIN